MVGSQVQNWLGIRHQYVDGECKQNRDWVGLKNHNFGMSYQLGPANPVFSPLNKPSVDLWQTLTAKL